MIKKLTEIQSELKDIKCDDNLYLENLNAIWSENYKVLETELADVNKCWEFAKGVNTYASELIDVIYKNFPTEDEVDLLIKKYEDDLSVETNPQWIDFFKDRIKKLGQLKIITHNISKNYTSITPKPYSFDTTYYEETEDE